MAGKPKKSIRLPMRLILIIVLLAVQLGLMITAIYMLTLNSGWVSVGLYAISVISVFLIVVRSGNPSIKLPWVIFILAVPIAGGIVYLLWGGVRTLPHTKARMGTAEAHQKSFLEANNDTADALRAAEPAYFRQSEYLSRCSGYPVYSDTSLEYHSPCDAGFERVLEELEMANNYIFMEFFILAEGQMWNRIYSILKRKAAQGLDIRVMFDDFGSVTRQYRGFIGKLKANGIKVSVFNPLQPSLNIFMNNRNHRKSIIIDGKTAISGGFNIGDEYINLDHRLGHWMDNVLILKGEAVRSFVVMFCSMWNFTSKKYKLNATEYFGYNDRVGRGFVQPYCDSPLNDENPAEGIYLKMINGARKYVYITTPYLILDSEMEMAIIMAAKSGVDVRIVTPRIRDKWYVHPVTQSFYQPLMDAGVKIYEYTPGFIHSKVVISDDTVATVGTVNMDFRSFYYHFESGVWICDNPVIDDIKENVLSVMVRSQEIDREKWKKRPWLMKFKQAFLKLFAPLM